MQKDHESNKDSSLPPVMYRESARLYYRPIEEGDYLCAYRWINDPAISRYVLAYLPMSLKVEREWIESASTTRKSLILAIIEKETDKHIGNASLSWDRHNSEKNHTAALGIMIGEKSVWGKGYGTETIGTLLDIAFRTLNLRKVNSSVISSNIGSYKCHIKNGFREYGRNPGEHFVEGTYHDETMLTIFKDEWLTLQKKDRK